ncbi:hypothetical protein DERF_003247 [Dermatophagoides farinae]|uniref:Uncharacterized protein n=1 Tax=Dermatophagoides farinae TaxID=6954 RepID=A0A922LBB9_DERFA|nr:hypothetical protein DERF_003247 [Dermatophagoides farinae]
MAIFCNVQQDHYNHEMGSKKKAVQQPQDSQDLFSVPFPTMIAPNDAPSK